MLPWKSVVTARGAENEAGGWSTPGTPGGIGQSPGSATGSATSVLQPPVSERNGSKTWVSAAEAIPEMPASIAAETVANSTHLAIILIIHCPISRLGVGCFPGGYTYPPGKAVVLGTEPPSQQ